MSDTPVRLIWYRNDLRTYDHPALLSGTPETLLPIYILPRRLAGVSSFGFPRLGGYRARFLIESLETLQANLAVLGSDLLLAFGEPEVILCELCERIGATEIWLQKEVGTEEEEEEHRLRRALQRLASPPELTVWEGQTMYQPDPDLFGGSWEGMPDLYSSVRKRLEKEGSVPAPLPAPQRLAGLPEAAAKARSAGPEGRYFDNPRALLAAAGVGERSPDRRTAYPFSGGEDAAKARVREYFWETDRLARYKNTRNGLLGEGYSSKLSAWLANGSLSARWVYEEVKRYEAERKKNVSTYWLVLELTWRDYFNLLLRKYDAELFKLQGPAGRYFEWSVEAERFLRWREGETGVPFIDANMRELAMTGYMSNRGRQNVASYLARDLGLDWRMGAEWFEFLLIDYDPASNWGNWTYNCGVGTDTRLDRYFSPQRQAEKYDRKGEYQRYWLEDSASSLRFDTP